MCVVVCGVGGVDGAGGVFVVVFSAAALRQCCFRSLDGVLNEVGHHVALSSIGSTVSRVDLRFPSEFLYDGPAAIAALTVDFEAALCRTVSEPG